MLSITKQANKAPNNKRRKWRTVVVKTNKRYTVNLPESSSKAKIALLLNAPPPQFLPCQKSLFSKTKPHSQKSSLRELFFLCKALPKTSYPPALSASLFSFSLHHKCFLKLTSLNPIKSVGSPSFSAFALKTNILLSTKNQPTLNFFFLST